MFAGVVLGSPPVGRAFVLALQGELGAGKTTFAQGFAKGLGVRERVVSPTFIISRRSVIPKRSRFKFFFHIDCYRLQSPGKISGIGWNDIMSDPENIVLIEWPERVKKLLPKGTKTIRFSHAGRDKRKISL